MKKRPGPFYWLAAAVFLALTLGPFFCAVLVSLTPEYEMFRSGGGFFPVSLTLANYAAILDPASSQHALLFTSLGNSVRATVLTLALTLPTAVLTAYALSRFRFRGRLFFRGALLITMGIPVFATIIPIYQMYALHRLLNHTFWLSLVYASAFLPMATWLISNYFSTLPRELEDAARVDGCGYFACLWRVILPVSYPILFSAGLLIALNTWNQFQIPLILAAYYTTKPVSVAVSEFMSKTMIHYGVTAVAGLMAILPPVLLAVVFRRFLVSGMVKGAVR